MKLTDQHIDRCPLCGAWRWRMRCATPGHASKPGSTRIKRGGVVLLNRAAS